MKKITLLVGLAVMTMMVSSAYSEEKKEAPKKVLVKSKVEPAVKEKPAPAKAKTPAVSAEKKAPAKAKTPAVSAVKKAPAKAKAPAKVGEKKQVAKKTKAPAAAKKAPKGKVLGGPIVSIDTKTQVVVIKRKEKEYPVTLTSETKITQGDKAITLADLKAGNPITAIYSKDAKGVRIAKSVNLDAAAPAKTKKAPVKVEKAPAAPAKKKVVKRAAPKKEPAPVKAKAPAAAKETKPAPKKAPEKK